MLHHAVGPNWRRSIVHTIIIILLLSRILLESSIKPWIVAGGDVFVTDRFFSCN